MVISPIGDRTERLSIIKSVLLVAASSEASGSEGSGTAEGTGVGVDVGAEGSVGAEGTGVDESSLNKSPPSV